MKEDREDEVIASEARLLDAMRTNNVELLSSLLHDDLLFIGPAGDTATKSMDLINYRSGRINLERVESRDLQVSIIGDNAVVAVTVTIMGNYMGQVVDGQFRYLRVWKCFDGAWRVIGGSVVTLAAAT